MRNLSESPQTAQTKKLPPAPMGLLVKAAGFVLIILGAMTALSTASLLNAPAAMLVWPVVLACMELLCGLVSLKLSVRLRWSPLLCMLGTVLLLVVILSMAIGNYAGERQWPIVVALVTACLYLGGSAWNYIVYKKSGVR